MYKIRTLQKFGIQAITLYPFILFSSAKEEIPESLFRHELEHIYQVEREGWFQFYFFYLKLYFQNRLKGMNHQQAYLKNPYEIAARTEESQPLVSSEVAKLGLNNSHWS